MRLKGIFVLFLLIPFVVAFAQSKKPLTNDDIIQMVKAGFAEQTILGAIKANDTAFDTSVQGLMALKNAGVSQPITDAVLSAEALKRAGSQPSTQPSASPVIAPSASGGTANPLLQQADDLDRQANEAAAKAQEQEQKAQNLGSSGIGGLLSRKYSMQAKQSRNKETQYRQQAQQLRAQATGTQGSQQSGQTGAVSPSASPGNSGYPTAGQKPTPPTGYQISDSGLCSVMYPEDWKAYPARDAVVLSPEPQPVDYSGMNTRHPNYGAYIAAFHLPGAAGSIDNELTENHFQGLIASLRYQATREGDLNAWGPQLGYATPMMINGRAARGAEFTRFTKKRAWVIAIVPPGHGMGHGDFFTFYVEFLAPEAEFESHRPIFEKIANSIVVKDIGLPQRGPTQGARRSAPTPQAPAALPASARSPQQGSAKGNEPAGTEPSTSATFGVSNQDGTELRSLQFEGPRLNQLNVAICGKDSVHSVKFKNGDNPSFQILDGKVGPNQYCLISDRSFLTGRNFISAQQESRLIPCDQNTVSAIAAAEKRGVQKCQQVGLAGTGWPVMVAEFERRGPDLLAALVLKRPGQLIVYEEPAKYDAENDSGWALGDHGHLDFGDPNVRFNNVFGLMFAFQKESNGAIDLVITRAGGEGTNIFLLQSSGNTFRAVAHGYQGVQ
jgi:hypothetical protein